jgi:hypothetical protein
MSILSGAIFIDVGHISQSQKEVFPDLMYKASVEE